jgi:hypothetical protein
MPLEMIWTIIGFSLTVMVLSYILVGDNFLFRLASYLFVGAASGYVFVVVLVQVIWPKMIQPLVFGPGLEPRLLALPPLILGLLLLFKLSPRLSRVGNFSMAWLVGSGAAITIGGAVLGTIFPQFLGTVNLFDMRLAQASGTDPSLQLVDALIILLGTITTLAYFYYTIQNKPNQLVQRPSWIESMSKFGQVFIGITLGSLFAGVYSAALTALVERVGFLWNFIRVLIG